MFLEVLRLSLTRSLAKSLGTLKSFLSAHLAKRNCSLELRLLSPAFQASSFAEFVVGLALPLPPPLGCVGAEGLTRASTLGLGLAVEVLGRGVVVIFFSRIPRLPGPCVGLPLLLSKPSLRSALGLTLGLTLGMFFKSSA